MRLRHDGAAPKLRLHDGAAQLLLPPSSGCSSMVVSIMIDPLTVPACSHQRVHGRIMLSMHRLVVTRQEHVLKLSVSLKQRMLASRLALDHHRACVHCCRLGNASMLVSSARPSLACCACVIFLY